MGWLGSLVGKVVGGVANAATGGAAGKVWSIGKGVLARRDAMRRKVEVPKQLVGVKLAGPMVKTPGIIPQRYSTAMPGGAPVCHTDMECELWDRAQARKKRRRSAKRSSSRGGRTRRRGRRKSSGGARRFSAKQLANQRRFAEMARARRKRS